MHTNPVAKPEQRSAIRQLIGKEFFILKRRLDWLLGSEKYALTIQHKHLTIPIFTHKSFLLRPLKDVDMVLQHNKITNLRLAIKHNWRALFFLNNLFIVIHIHSR
jgi:vancomycin resistance protein VanW